MIRLLFPLADVQRLAEHAFAATEHRPSFRDTLEDTTPVPALWFVGDEGLYLMSNGVPHLPSPENPDWPLVVYAEGYRTSADKHTVDRVIGGDDFCEVLPLLTPLPDGRILHTEIVIGITCGATHFAIDMDTTTFAHYVVDSPAREENR